MVRVGERRAHSSALGIFFFFLHYSSWSDLNRICYTMFYICSLIFPLEYFVSQNAVLYICKTKGPWQSCASQYNKTFMFLILCIFKGSPFRNILWSQQLSLSACMEAENVTSYFDRVLILLTFLVICIFCEKKVPLKAAYIIVRLAKRLSKSTSNTSPKTYFQNTCK